MFERGFRTYLPTLAKVALGLLAFAAIVILAIMTVQWARNDEPKTEQAVDQAQQAEQQATDEQAQSPALPGVPETETPPTPAPTPSPTPAPTPAPNPAPTTSAATSTPRTGPEDIIFGALMLGALSGAGYAYVNSRRDLHSGLRGQ